MTAQIRYNALIKRSLKFNKWERYGITYLQFWENLNAQWLDCQNEAQRIICVESGEGRLSVYEGKPQEEPAVKTDAPKPERDKSKLPF